MDEHQDETPTGAIPASPSTPPAEQPTQAAEQQTQPPQPVEQPTQPTQPAEQPTGQPMSPTGQPFGPPFGQPLASKLPSPGSASATPPRSSQTETVSALLLSSVLPILASCSGTQAAALSAPRLESNQASACSRVLFIMHLGVDRAGDPSLRAACERAREG